MEQSQSNRRVPRWVHSVPFWGVHVAAVIGAIAVGWSWAAFWWLAITYFVRMFAVTAGYHRYFAHRTFKTSRAFQFLLALVAVSTAQQGVLWWAAHHRNHHKYSDQEQDIHSPKKGFWWSHVGWIVSGQYDKTDYDRIKDFAKYPELRWLDRWQLAIPIATGFFIYWAGGSTALFWGHFVSLVVVWHVTFCINSLAHVFGSRRYATTDTSRNNFLLAILTLGEGWHNNHHHYQRSACQGFYWWEVDISYYLLKGLEKLRIVSDVQGVPKHVRDEAVAPNRARLEGLVVPPIVAPPAALVVPKTGPVAQPTAP